MFARRNLIIATKHEKELVITPILEKELGVKCFIDSNLDTDLLGTFTGEIERENDSVTTARKKCFFAMDLTNCDLAVASEGSFGPHPNNYFVSADDEFLIFIDRKNDLEIIVREISIYTNFNGDEIKTHEELSNFVQRTKFPTHGLIVKKSKNDFSEIVKGIINHEHLYNTFDYFISCYGTAYIETDMRAMYNPTRMKVIEQVTKKLAEKINSLCPNCKIPGFGISKATQGLPCQVCCHPTHSTLSYIYTCQKCSFSKEEMHPNGKFTEDPTYCDVCNP